MNKVNVGLIRLLQFIVFVFFTFLVMTYFGILLLLPLDAIALLIKVMTAVGINGMIAALVAVPVVVYLGYATYKIPGLCSTLIDIGMELVSTGKTRIEQFNEMAEAVAESK